MFALAIWDERRRRLVLARDRAGEKPLFYARVAHEIWFASEVQALLAHPRVARAQDPAALYDFLNLGYVPEPRTMFRGIRKVEAGSVATFGADTEEAHVFWRPERVAEAPLAVEQAERRLEALLETAVARQLQADVPLGVFISGGVDSGLLAAMAARGGRRGALHTFTVGFAARGYDERSPAAAVAAQLGTEHHTVTANEDTLFEAFETVTARVAEPVADPAIFPTYLLAKAARPHAGVVLSGEGADELFGGYPTYLGHRAAPWFNALPAALQRGVTRLLGALPPSHGKVPLEFLLKRFVTEAGRDPLERHIAWFGTGLEAAAITLGVPAGTLPDGARRAAAAQWRELLEGEPDVLRRVMLFDYLTYLRDNLLVKVDRATMLASLEARAPYLDRTLTAFVLGLPTDLKVRGPVTKWLLKRVAARWLPRRIARRRKRGLSVPVAEWINRGLRTVVDGLLAPERLHAEGVLHPARVGQLLSEHRDGRANHARALWPLIIYRAWRERWAGD
jgi:asparagine synthase (glutamine-hydrolysing)